MNRYIKINQCGWSNETEEYETKLIRFLNTNNIVEIRPDNPGFSLVRFWNGKVLEEIYTKETTAELIKNIAKIES